MKKLLTGFFIISLIFSSCKKEAGEGGNSTIKGNVAKKVYDPSFSFEKEEIPAQGEDVFIIYGNEEASGDDVKTDQAGNYEFRYLREGRYKVYAYSQDSANPQSDKKLVIIKDVEITKKKQSVQAPRIIIKEGI